MKKIILIPDSFKGTLSSGQICTIMARAIKRHRPETEVISIPVADGGEGSVASFMAALGGQEIKLTVQGPFTEPVKSFYGLLPDKTAVVEMAAAAGLPLAGGKKRPDLATTYGVGQLIEHAVGNGCKKLIIGLGGSSSNDGGCGAAAALGVEFFDSAGNPFIPVGATLHKIARIKTQGLLARLKNLPVVVMCDIDNPFCGPQGAAHIFAPQKGAGPDMVRQLDEGLCHLAAIIKQDLGQDIQYVAGAGAAGGMGGGMQAFLGAELRMGIETVLDTVGFDKLAADADLVISGEGRIDNQSLRGKVVIGTARRTRQLLVPLIAIVGDIGPDIESVYAEGVTAIFSINRVAVPFSQARLRAKADLELTMDNLIRFLKAWPGS